MSKIPTYPFNSVNNTSINSNDCKNSSNTLCVFRHVDGELAAEGVHSHHAVGGSVGERRDLVVVAGNAVERLGDVGRPLQDDLLGEDTDKRDVRKRVGTRCVDPSTAEVPTSL